MKKAKLEILTALQESDNSKIEFYHQYGGDRDTSETKTITIESKNFKIQLELKESIKWNKTGTDYENVGFDVVKLTAIDENGWDYGDNFTDEEILEAINY